MAPSGKQIVPKLGKCHQRSSFSNHPDHNWSKVLCHSLLVCLYDFFPIEMSTWKEELFIPGSLLKSLKLMYCIIIQSGYCHSNLGVHMTDTLVTLVTFLRILGFCTSKTSRYSIPYFISEQQPRKQCS